MLKDSAESWRRAAVVVAAGQGRRMGGSVPKQYRMLGTKPVLRHTLDALKACGLTDIVVVVSEDTDEWEPLSGEGVQFVHGGSTRTESVRNGLNLLKPAQPDVVFIHDGARPFVSKKIVDDVDEALRRYQAVVPILPIADAVKAWDSDAVGDDLDRAAMMRVQTPQAFHFGPYVDAIENYTGASSDDIAIARDAGMTVGWVQGDERNFKLTYRSDFERAQELVATNRVGMGYDVHRIGSGEGIWLCGVWIPCDFSLIGHSDADVGLHAITDAVLGACALGDIGDHFPPSDPQWKGAASDQFLAHAVSLSEALIDSIDVTLVCERPKVKPYREAMRLRVAEICAVDVDRVSVKATTTESLGFEGRGEGISAQAVVSVRR